MLIVSKREIREKEWVRESQLVSNSKVSLLPDKRKTPWSGEGEVGRSRSQVPDGFLRKMS